MDVQLSQLRRAQDPVTPPEILERLALAEDVEVRRAVVLNPNTSLAVLLRLVEEFPREFLENPIIPMLQFVQPEYASGLSAIGCLQLLRFETASEQLVKTICTGSRVEHVREAATLHVSLAGEIASEPGALLKFVGNLSVSEGAMLAFILALPEAARGMVVALDMGLFVQEKRAVIEHCDAITDEDLAMLVREEDVTILGAIAMHPRISGATLSKLWKKIDHSLIESQTLTWPMRKIEEYRDAYTNLLLIITQHPAISGELASVIVTHRNIKARRAVAVHPILSMEDRLVLMKDQDASVRAAVALRGDLTVDEYMELALDSDLLVRYRIRTNKQVPEFIRDMLPQESLQGLQERVLHQTSLPLVPKIQVKQGMTDGDINMPEEKIKDLLLKGRYTEMLRVLEQYPASRSEKRKLFQAWLEQGLARSVMGTSRSALAFFLLQAPDLPISCLTLIARGLHWQERYLVTRQRCASVELLSELSHDGNQYVRYGAREALRKREGDG